MHGDSISCLDYRTTTRGLAFSITELSSAWKCMSIVDTKAQYQIILEHRSQFLLGLELSFAVRKTSFYRKQSPRYGVDSPPGSLLVQVFDDTLTLSRGLMAQSVNLAIWASSDLDRIVFHW
ncbi:hypothetical protein PABG_11941 [Paracoccidioides brasiliensis Pb03]|nr:hypothetical protein PABG_11941 [Paracoccidioides brasiliensis Pb03]